MNPNEVVKLHLLIIIVLLSASVIFSFLDWRTNSGRLKEDVRINDFYISSYE